MTSALRGRGSGDYGFDDGFTILVLDRAKIAAMMLPGGMVYSFTKKTVEEIELVAKAKLLPGRGFRTGELSRSVGHSVTPTAGTVVGSVRATSRHAIFYHNGTIGHRIEPRRPDGVLAFRIFHGFSEVIYARSVWHPGFAGHPFLREAQDEVLSARGIAV